MGSPQCNITELPTYSPTYGVAAMQHHGIAHIQPDVAYSCRVVSADEKHKVAGLGLIRRDRGTDVVKALRRQASHVPSTVIDYPTDKAAAIKGSRRAGTAPHIGIADVFICLRNHGRKGFILQSLRRDFIVGRLLDGGSIGIAAAWEQIGPVSQRLHIGGI